MKEENEKRKEDEERREERQRGNKRLGEVSREERKKFDGKERIFCEETSNERRPIRKEAAPGQPF